MSGGSCHSPSYAITAPVWHPGVTCCWRLGSRVVNHVTLHCLIPNTTIFCVSQIGLPFIHSSMALQPVVGPWPLLQFRNLFHTVGRTPWTSDQPVAKDYLYSIYIIFRILTFVQLETILHSSILVNTEENVGS
jgi:hypothetical protein